MRTYSDWVCISIRISCEDFSTLRACLKKKKNKKKLSQSFSSKLSKRIEKFPYKTRGWEKKCAIEIDHPTMVCIYILSNHLVSLLLPSLWFMTEKEKRKATCIYFSTLFYIRIYLPWILYFSKTGFRSLPLFLPRDIKLAKKKIIQMYFESHWESIAIRPWRQW